MALKSPLMHVMHSAARKAARNLVRDFGEVENLQVSKKGPSDYVSAADLKAERTLRAELSKARPDFGFKLEEAGIIEGKDERHVFVIDPLDGTTNFLHGIPHFAISIAVLEDGEPIAGLIYDPVKDEMFWAEKGQGAYINERRLRVSARTKLPDAVVATGIPFHGRGDHARFGAELAVMSSELAGIRRFGAASLDLDYVAAARFDGFWERGLSAWDIAAGILLIREAGGVVTDPQGGDTMLASGDIVAANDKLHSSLVRLLRKAVRPAH